MQIKQIFKIFNIAFLITILFSSISPLLDLATWDNNVLMVYPGGNLHKNDLTYVKLIDDPLTEGNQNNLVSLLAQESVFNITNSKTQGYRVTNQDIKDYFAKYPRVLRSLKQTTNQNLLNRSYKHIITRIINSKYQDLRQLNRKLPSIPVKIAIRPLTTKDHQKINQNIINLSNDLIASKAKLAEFNDYEVEFDYIILPYNIKVSNNLLKRTYYSSPSYYPELRYGYLIDLPEIQAEQAIKEIELSITKDNLFPVKYFPYLKSRYHKQPKDNSIYVKGLFELKLGQTKKMPDGKYVVLTKIDPIKTLSFEDSKGDIYQKVYNESLLARKKILARQITKSHDFSKGALVKVSLNDNNDPHHDAAIKFIINPGLTQYGTFNESGLVIYKLRSITKKLNKAKLIEHLKSDYYYDSSTNTTEIRLPSTSSLYPRIVTYLINNHKGALVSGSDLIFVERTPETDLYLNKISAYDMLYGFNFDDFVINESKNHYNSRIFNLAVNSSNSANSDYNATADIADDQEN